MNVARAAALSLQSLSGFHRIGTCFAFGALSALAFPPFGAIPFLLISFPAFAFLLQGSSRIRDSFWIGWAFAFGLLIPCFAWMNAAMFVDIASFWWALPFGLAGLPAALAIYYGLASAIAWRCSDLRRVSGLVLLALLWFLAEWMRGNLLTGFPWDMLGYVWSDTLPMLQTTSLVGIEGLTLITALVAFIPALWAWTTAREKHIAIALTLMGLILMSGLSVWGFARLSTNQTSFTEHVRLRVVQPDTDQSTKWDPQKRADNFERLVTLTFGNEEANDITHFIWPETASAFYLGEEEDMRRFLAARLKPGTQLITGSVRRELVGPGDLRYYNSLLAINHEGSVTAIYDKHHLVPFGEYMPFEKIIPFRTISLMGKPFTAGEGLHTTHVAGLPPFSGLICYEAIFSGDVSPPDGKSNWLLNLTNDAWYDGTHGPAQHFYISRTRAVEEGLPMVRSANKGITGVIDPLGRIIASTGYDRAGFVDSPLPKALPEETVFAKTGGMSAWFPAVFLFLLFLALRRLKA